MWCQAAWQGPRGGPVHKLGVQGVADELGTGRLGWYGHVARASSRAGSVTSVAVPDPVGVLEQVSMFAAWGALVPGVGRRRGLVCVGGGGDKPTAAYPRYWETICSLNIKPGF